MPLNARIVELEVLACRLAERRFVEFGDVAGHPFHGNQWNDVGAADPAAAKSARQDIRRVKDIMSKQTESPTAIHREAAVAAYEELSENRAQGDSWDEEWQNGVHDAHHNFLEAISSPAVHEDTPTLFNQMYTDAQDEHGYAAVAADQTKDRNTQLEAAYAEGKAAYFETVKEKLPK